MVKNKKEVPVKVHGVLYAFYLVFIVCFLVKKFPRAVQTYGFHLCGLSYVENFLHALQVCGFSPV